MEKIQETIPKDIISESFKKKLNSLSYDNLVINGKLEISELAENLHEQISLAKTEEEWDRVISIFRHGMHHLDDDDFENEIFEEVKEYLLKKAYINKK